MNEALVFLGDPFARSKPWAPSQVRHDFPIDDSQPHETIRVLREYLSSNPVDADLLQLLAMAHLKFANSNDVDLKAAASHFEAAEKLFNEAIALDQNPQTIAQERRLMVSRYCLVRITFNKNRDTKALDHHL